MTFKQAIIAVLLLWSSSSLAQTKIILETKEEAPIISRNIYGHFAEHLGRCIYDGIYVGDTSSIENVDGVRKDIIDALRELQIPNLRWPGGCFADTYHWKDGVGPKEQRPSIVNTWWGGVTEDNSFGTHNFLNLCELLSCEPYLAANVGSGTVQEFTEWIQYVNHDGSSPMADWRRVNGREEAWDVKFWGVGNEVWGCGGNMSVEYYTNVYKQYATFMTKWGDRDLYRVACGAGGADYNWTKVLLENVPSKLIDAVALHHYAVVDWEDKGPSVDFTEEQYFKIMKEALFMKELVEGHIEVMDKYDPENSIDLVVDEWGGWYTPDGNPGFLNQQSTIRDAMIAGVTLNIFNNRADRVKMANLAQIVNVLQAVILTQGEKMILTPTYHVMNMYKVHQDAELISTDFVSPKYTYEGKELDAVSISASKKNGQTHVSLVNIDSNKKNRIELDLSQLGKFNKVKAQVLTSEKLQDHNTYDTPENIVPMEYKDFKIKDSVLSFEMPKHSVIVFELN